MTARGPGFSPTRWLLPVKGVIALMLPLALVFSPHASR